MRPEQFPRREHEFVIKPDNAAIYGTLQKRIHALGISCLVTTSPEGIYGGVNLVEHDDNTFYCGDPNFQFWLDDNGTWNLMISDMESEHDKHNHYTFSDPEELIAFIETFFSKF